MKRMRKSGLILFLALSFSACVQLDFEPEDAYSPDTFFTTREAAVSNLAAVYQSTKMSGFFEDGNAILMDAITDIAYCPFSNQLISFIATGTATPSMSDLYVDLYRDYFNYSGIRTANYFLENVDKVPMSVFEIEQMKAEVRFLRAFNYARKMMCFGGVPLVTRVLQYGEETKIPRSTEDEITAFVLNELKTVADLLPESRPLVERGRITKGAALALKARVELFAKNYDQAAKDAKAVMDLQLYDLYTDYEGLFWEVNQDDEKRNMEVLLEVCYKAPVYASDLGALYTVEEGGWNSINPTQRLVDTYETIHGLKIDEDETYDPDQPYKNRDPRLSASVIYPGQSWNGRIFNSLQIVGEVDEYYNSSKPNRSKTGYCLRKYCAPLDKLKNNSPEIGQNVNFIVIRYAEVLLTYAEALIEMNKDLDLAKTAIDKVRMRAGMPVLTVTDQAGLRKALRNERCVELAFEGLRWFDIKRWNIGKEVMNGPVYGVRPGVINMSTSEITFTSPDHIVVGDIRVFDVNRDYYFPIPQEDIDANPALQGHQNPNW